MTMLVFGGRGRVGEVMCGVAREQGWEVLAPGRDECDLRFPEDVAQYVLAHPAEAVVNCAAISGLEACLDDPLSAHMVNAVAPAQMALACRHTGARFVHLSTDYVLDGRRTGLKSEATKCKPINTYGESKREGELQTLEALSTALILRISWVCGNPHRPSFVESILARALRGEPLAAIADKYSLPTHAEDIARSILTLIPRQISGIYHLASVGEPISWHGCATLALQCAHQAGALPQLPPIAPQKLAELTSFRTPRPMHTAMDTAALRALGLPLPGTADTICRAVQGYLAARAE